MSPLTRPAPPVLGRDVTFTWAQDVFSIVRRTGPSVAYEYWNPLSPMKAVALSYLWTLGGISLTN